jgi:MFS family permease
MLSASPARSTAYLLFIAGMGGLLYGIDVGIIAGALPYLESTASVAWKLRRQELSFIVAAVLLGSVLSSLFAGALADLVGRRWAMALAGALFTLSIPVIALADGYTPLLLGRLLQGVSGGLIGVIVPLYLAECLHARQRGRGAALFQLLLTVGLVAAAVIGLVQAQQRGNGGPGGAALPEAARAAAVLAAKDHAWRASSGCAWRRAWCSPPAACCWPSRRAGWHGAAAGTGARGAAAHPQSGRSGTGTAEMQAPPARAAQRGRFRCCRAATCCPSCWPA